MRFTAFLFFLTAFFMINPAFAADSDKETIPPQQSEKKQELENPFVKAINDKAEALAKTMTSEEAKALGLVRENFGYLRSIEIALQSVDDAVAQCGEKNPDIKENITTRHKEWAGKINSVYSEQNKKLDASLDEKNFKNPALVKDYLDAIDTMAKDSEKKIDKKVVTTPEACNSLKESMNETEKVILTILEEMRWPEKAPKEESAAP